ncbi:MAG: alpha/beta hydrolase [Dehalococcoidia bacterium]
MSAFDERRLTFETSGGLRLEGALRLLPGASFGAVVLHPHPQFGGDMHNHVVLALCRVFTERGASTLRFNFRGTGASGGVFDGGCGQADDARAAVGTLQAGMPGAPVVLAGYSFGSQIAASVAADLALAGLVLVSPPLGYAPLPALPPGLPVLACGGDADPVCPPEMLRALAGPSLAVSIIPGADHGWSSGLDRLAAEIASFDAHLVG